MKKTLVISLTLLLAASFALAKNVEKGPELNIKSSSPVTDNSTMRDLGMDVPRAAAQIDTFVLGYFTFDAGPACTPEGWSTVDRTAQDAEYWHVDDFAGISPGVTGMLNPLEGLQSLWCGIRPGPGVPECGYATAPGYGNNWNQSWCLTECATVTTGVSISFSVFWDSEPGYDATTLQLDNCDENWVDLYGGTGTFDGTGTDTLTIAVSDTLHSGSIQFRFQFVSDGAWSDADGLWNTDGAIMIDELSVDDVDGNVVPYENFEDPDDVVGAIATADWNACNDPGYGDFAALYPGLGVLQEDPCQFDPTCLWTFYTGSTEDYACDGHPEQTTVPYENARGQYIHNEIWSPFFPAVGAGSVWELAFDVYRDLDLDALVFYVWHVRGRNDLDGGCPSGWDDYGFVYYGGGKDWLRTTFGMGQFIPQGSTDISIAIGVRDMCGFWCGVYGSGQCHSHAPLIDNVELYRVDSAGPQWQVRDLDLFQDNFSADGTLTGTARADAAQDILPNTSAGILPGDSVSVTVSDPSAGLGVDVDGRAAVYCYVRVDGPHGGVTTADLTDDNVRYTYRGTVVADGYTWAKIQMDSSYTAGGSVVADDYNIDLNDSYFVPGDTVWFFFGAANSIGQETYYAIPSASPTNQSDDIDYIASTPDEFTILPAVGLAQGNDILYVDGMNFRGAQQYFDTAFQMLGIFDKVDRYDIRGPSSAVANHPGSRVVDINQQLIGVYRKIIYNTGDLVTALGDGSGTPDKSPDTQMLLTFMDNLLQTGGVYVSGDDIAEEWDRTFTDASAITLRVTYMNYVLITGDHTTLMDVSPYGIGDPTGFFIDTTPPFAVDTLIAYGGCPLINDFDVIGPTGTSRAQMWYKDPGLGWPAILSQTSTNGLTTQVRFVLSGFSFHYIRDAYPASTPARAEHMWRILLYLQNVVDAPVGGETPTAFNELDQNRPNPFNPTTTISFQVREAGLVSLKIYNVAGQLVKTLFDGQRNAGEVYQATWNGLNDAGQPVSSGVYFYKLVAKNFTQTKKMVLLK